MKKMNHSLRTRVPALLLALVCILGLFPATALAAGDTIKLERFGMSGVSYESAALGRCSLHEMYFSGGNKTSVGFCGTKGAGMGSSLIGQTWGNKTPVSDPTVLTMIFGNCDFLYMLSQAAGDQKVLASHLGISPHQLSYVTHSGSGEGLLFYGDTTIPFVDHFPQDTELYTLLTTKPEDKANGQE